MSKVSASATGNSLNMSKVSIEDLSIFLTKATLSRLLDGCYGNEGVTRSSSRCCAQQLRTSGSPTAAKKLGLFEFSQ